MIKYLQYTLESIIRQNNENIEVIIVDGGSDDGTLELLENYKTKLTTFISEKDEGMYHAIQKGFSFARGEIMCWLNADDIYFPWTINTVLSVFEKYENISWLCGIPSFMNEDGSLKKNYSKVSCKSRLAIKNGWYNNSGLGYLQQESMFWRRTLYEKCGGINLNYKYAADFDLWCRFAIYEELWTVDMPLASFRIRNSSLSKKYISTYEKEVRIITLKMSKFPVPLFYLSKNIFFNKFIRVLFYAKTNIVMYSMYSDDLLTVNCYKNASSLFLSQLFLEYKVRFSK